MRADVSTITGGRSNASAQRAGSRCSCRLIPWLETVDDGVFSRWPSWSISLPASRERGDRRPPPTTGSSTRSLINLRQPPAFARRVRVSRRFPGRDAVSASPSHQPGRPTGRIRAYGALTRRPGAPNPYPAPHNHQWLETVPLGSGPRGGGGGRRPSAARMMRAASHRRVLASAAVILGAHHAQHAATRQHTGGIPGARDAVPDVLVRLSGRPGVFPHACGGQGGTSCAGSAAYPLGAALWWTQAHFCLFSCCMMRHVRDAGWTGGRAIDRGRRDTIDCWECQAKGWVWLDTANGNCWVCELPTTKRLLKGHCVEAPCQLCLWGETR